MQVARDKIIIIMLTAIFTYHHASVYAAVGPAAPSASSAAAPGIEAERAAAQAEAEKFEKRLATIVPASSFDLIGQKLTPSNALFPRQIWGKDKSGQEVELKTTPRTLLIFLDDDEDKAASAVTLSLAWAIHQKAAPILTSARLLGNVFRLGATNSNSALLLLRITQEFNPQEWLIAKVKDCQYLYLMIPRAYLNKHSTSPEADPSATIGLHILRQHIILDSKEEWLKRWTGAPVKSNGVQEFQDIIPNPDRSLFIPTSYYHSRQSPIPQWALCLMGHGSQAQLFGWTPRKVAALSVKQFAYLLDSLEQHILTKLLVYISCYASGASRIDLYEESRTRIGKRPYSYAIIAIGSSDTPTDMPMITNYTAYDPTISIPLTSRESAIPPVRYHNFVDLVESENPASYLAIAAAAIPTIQWAVPHRLEQIDDIPEHFTPENLPIVRPPGSNAFYPIIEEVHISNAMAGARNTPLNIAQHAHWRLARTFGVSGNRHEIGEAGGLPQLPKGTPLFATLEPFYLPFELDIMRQETWREEPIYIISTRVPPRHYIQSVRTNIPSHDKYWSATFWALFDNIDYAGGASFFIKKLISTPSSVTAKRVTGSIKHDVLIHMNDRTTTIYFTDARGAEWKLKGEFLHWNNKSEPVTGKSYKTLPIYTQFFTPENKALIADIEKRRELLKKALVQKMALGPQGHKGLMDELELKRKRAIPRAKL